MITYDVHVLIGREDPEKRLLVKQHDTGVNVRVYPEVARPVSKYREEIAAYAIPDGVTAYLDVAKADKTRVTVSGTIEGAAVLFSCGPQAFTVAGEALAEMTLYAPDGRCITTATFRIDVQEEVACGCEVDSENYVDVFAQHLESVRELCAQANDAASEALKVAAEAAQSVAQVGADGVAAVENMRDESMGDVERAGVVACENVNIAQEAGVEAVQEAAAQELEKLADTVLETVHEWAKQPEKPKYTAAEVGALPDDTVIPEAYTLPVATTDTLGGVKVGNGLVMDGEFLGVKPDSEWERIEVLTLTEDSNAIERTAYPDGTPYDLSAVKVIARIYYPIVKQIGTQLAFYCKNKTLGRLVTNVYPSDKDNPQYKTTAIYQAKPVDGLYEFIGSLGVQGSPQEPYYPPDGQYQTESTKQKIDCIQYTAWSNIFPAGTNIEIWGVRADA